MSAPDWTALSRSGMRDAAPGEIPDGMEGLARMIARAAMGVAGDQGVQYGLCTAKADGHCQLVAFLFQASDPAVRVRVSVSMESGG